MEYPKRRDSPHGRYSRRSTEVEKVFYANIGDRVVNPIRNHAAVLSDGGRNLYPVVPDSSAHTIGLPRAGVTLHK